VGEQTREDLKKTRKKSDCPTCGETVEQANKSFPFCSPRCRMADLGKWMNEDYKISREMKETDLDELDV
jgi:endogenous inhibitor of DNA gyrase (YacG/DUF329 family)